VTIPHSHNSPLPIREAGPFPSLPLFPLSGSNPVVAASKH
jgi:hypothetical protein